MAVSAPNQYFFVDVKGMTYFSYKYTNSVAPSLLKYVEVDGVMMQNNQSISSNVTDLTFASDADMTPLAPGDIVSQGTGVIYDTKITNPQLIVDGDLDTFGGLPVNEYCVIVDLVEPMPTGDIENSVYLKYYTTSTITCILTLRDENGDRIGVDQTLNGTNGGVVSYNLG